MSNRKILELVGAIVGWTTLLVQFYLMQENRITDILETTIRYFSFFTILSNLLVTISFTTLFFSNLKLFRQFKTLTAFAVYISIVAIVYNIVLQFLWEPVGLQKLVDELLHVVIPIVFVYYWFKHVQAVKLNYSFIWKILVYPLIYLILVLVRGNFSGFYPYPFVDVSAIGFNQAFINSLIVLIAFVFVSALFIRVSRR